MSNFNSHPIDIDISNIIKDSLKDMKSKEKKDLDNIIKNFEERYGSNSNYSTILIYELCININTEPIPPKIIGENGNPVRSLLKKFAET